MGSYFGSELCPVDIDMDGTTDLLLVAAPFYHVRGQEGRVYVYRLHEQVGESPSLQLVQAAATGLVQGWPGWNRQGSGGEVLREDSGSLPPAPHFLIFPISSSHIGGDYSPSGSQVTKQALSSISPASLEPGRELSLTLYRPGS